MMVVWAYLLDQWLADPPHWPHPVKVIGRLVHQLEQWLYPSKGTRNRQLVGGLGLVVMVLAITMSVTWLSLKLVTGIHPLLGYGFSVYLAYTSLSAKGLKLAALEVLQPLESKDIEEARKKLSQIVGRDTGALSEEGIGRAVVETVAENFSDGVIAPLFYLVIGGVPLAILYKAVNTMDSMIGYKNDRYVYFGRAAAKVDDVMNWIPARLSVVFLVMAAFINGNDGWSAIKTAGKDGRNHKSPNAGWPEAAVAGSLGVQLGGANMYFGTLVDKPTIGEGKRTVDGKVIKQAVTLLDWATGMAIIVALAATVIIGGGL